MNNINRKFPVPGALLWANCGCTMTLSLADNRKFNYQLKQRGREEEFYKSLTPFKKKEFQAKWKSSPNFEFVEGFQNSCESFERKTRTTFVHFSELELLGKMGQAKASVYMEHMRTAGRFYVDVAGCEWFEFDQHSKEQVHNNMRSMVSQKATGPQRHGVVRLPALPAAAGLLALEDVDVEAEPSEVMCTFD